MIEVILIGSTILNVLAGIALMTMVKIIREERKHYQDFKGLCFEELLDFYGKEEDRN